jgi:hypothetical protein
VAPQRDPDDVARVLTSCFAEVRGAEMGLVPPSFAYDDHIGRGLEQQHARV